MSQYNSIPISQLQVGSAVKASDIFPATDITDLSQSSSGTTKKYSVEQLQTFLLGQFDGDNIRSALYCTTSNLTANYSNGTLGVGARLVNSGVLGPLTVDGSLVIAGDRILVPYQTSSFQNGVYEVTDAGDVGTPWVLTRVTDFDGSTLGEILQGNFIYVVFGSANGLTCWIVTSTSFPIVGTSPIVFEKQTNPITDAWVVTGVPTQMVANTGYTVTAPTTLTLPTGMAPGEWVEVNAQDGVLFTIAQNAGQYISVAGSGQTTVGVGGSIVSTVSNACIRLRCVVSSVQMDATSIVGTFLVT